ncbi:MAG: hypothetical protein K2M10_04975 [Muribaculaceae bacterium]|nr:hypothetical protein [Muribaculaceae bacterium]
MLFPVKNLLPALPLLLSLFSCSSTEVTDSLNPAPESSSISITLSAPEIKSRAGSDHMLRYTAHLIKGDIDHDSNTTVVEKKQMIEGTDGNTLTFEGVDEGTYSITLFADYIPTNTTKKENGEYDDVYYKTDVYNQIDIKTTGSGMINNDNYDCFGEYVVIKKEAAEKHEAVALKRLVAKVRFVANQSIPDDLKLTISKYSVNKSYDLTSRRAADFHEAGTTGWEITPSDPDNNELFYFYTFASSPSAAGEDGKSLRAFTFKAETGDLNPLTTEIESGEIEVKGNYITTVKGDFIPVKPDDPVTRTDRIILDLSTITGWGNED